jgi:hypothetical protein
MSGPYALAAAARYPDRIRAAASFYGTWLVSDAQESPHLTLGKGNAELYIACAEHDKLAPLPMVEELRGLFVKARSPGELELYPGVHHGFAFPGALVLRQAGRRAALGTAARALSPAARVAAISPQGRIMRVAHALAPHASDVREALLPGIEAAIFVSAASRAAAVGAVGRCCGFAPRQRRQREHCRDNKRHLPHGYGSFVQLSRWVRY